MLQQLLANETVVAHVQAAYQLAIAELEFLPLGADARASVYRVTATAGTRYFLKIRQGALNEPGLLIPHYLQAQGVSQVVAPLPTLATRVVATAWTYKLTCASVDTAAIRKFADAHIGQGQEH